MNHKPWMAATDGSFNVLAVDIETSGMDPCKHTLLGLGYAFMSSSGKVIASYQDNFYVPECTLWDLRTWNEFWSKNLAQLEKLRYTEEPSLGVTSNPVASAIVRFQKRRALWEKLSLEQTGSPLRLVGDNIAFDIAWLNHFIGLYTPDLPIPYVASRVVGVCMGPPAQQYGTLYDTGSVAHGILLGRYPGEAGKPGSATRRLGAREDWPESPAPHDHTPMNDAIFIAHAFVQMHTRGSL